MSEFSSNIDYTKFIQFNGGTLKVATFVEIRDALVQRFREIYGNDIDTSSASADGQYINSIALIINNILQTFQFAFDSLDPSIAKGKYLDVLCSYNNIQRIQQSNSVAQLWIHNESGATISNVPFLEFVDRNGIYWRWTNSVNADGDYEVQFEEGNTPITDVICEDGGNIQAFGNVFLDEDGQPTTLDNNDWSRECPGTIYRLINTDLNLQIWQEKDAVVGNEQETDESLRSRRYQMLGNSSVSVLQGLQGALENTIGIQDCAIFNNDTGNAITLTNGTATTPSGNEPYADGNTVLAHSVYVALRYKKGANVAANTIGKLIYNKMTPGIGTTPFGSTTTAPEYGHYEIQKTSNIKYNIYWKICQGRKVGIVLSMSCNPNIYDYPMTGSSIITAQHTPANDFEKNMSKNLIEYLNNIRINDYIRISKLLNIIQASDRQKQGQPTIFAQNGIIYSNGAPNIYTNYPLNLSYLDYTESDFKFEYIGNDKSLCRITIGTLV